MANEFLTFFLDSFNCLVLDNLLFYLRLYNSLLVKVTVADSTVECDNPGQILCSHQRDGEL